MSSDVASEFYRWQAANANLYTMPADKWRNKKWDAFIEKVLGRRYVSMEFYKQYAALKEAEHPMAKMYMLFDEVHRQTDGKLARGFSVGYMLPGVSKSKNERLRDSSNPLEYMEGALSQSFIAKADDEFLNPNIATDSAGNKLELLPILYTKQLDDIDQSYDLATVYYRYWEMGNRYSSMREIISTMEMTKNSLKPVKLLQQTQKAYQ